MYERKLSEALTKVKSTIHFRLIEESQSDQYKKYSVFERLQNCGNKQKSVAVMVQPRSQGVLTSCADQEAE